MVLLPPSKAGDDVSGGLNRVAVAGLRKPAHFNGTSRADTLAHLWTEQLILQNIVGHENIYDTIQTRCRRCVRSYHRRPVSTSFTFCFASRSRRVFFVGDAR